MTNKEVCNNFIHRITCSNKSLNSLDNKLFSYNTCIAQRINNESIILNTTKYSITTSKHQTILKNILNEYLKEDNVINTLYLVNNIQKNSNDLDYERNK